MALPDPVHPIPAFHCDTAEGSFCPALLPLLACEHCIEETVWGTCCGHLLCGCFLSIADVVRSREGFLLQLST